jgi:hypothetical protein
MIAANGRSRRREIAAIEALRLGGHPGVEPLHGAVGLAGGVEASKATGPL